MANRCQSHGGDTAALRTVRIAPELAGRYPRLQVGGNRARRSRENALLRTRRRHFDLAQHRLGHVEDWKPGAQAAQLGDDLRPLLTRQNLSIRCSALWRKQTEPHFRHLRTLAPEAQKVLEIPGPAGNLRSNRAVDADARQLSVFQDS